MAMIQGESLSYTYVDVDGKFTALDSVDFSIEEGEFACLVGHSGCGKSTLLNMIAGLLAPTGGSLLVNGRPVEGPGSDRAIVFQQYSLFPWQTARKNVEFGALHASKKHTKEQARDIAAKMLESVGMADFAERYPYQLSGGMQQRVALARALAMDPAILLLDEPFGALDAKRRSDLQELIEKLWSDSGKKKTIVFVTHDIDEAILLGDRVMFMRPGKISANLTVSFERPRNKEALRVSSDYKELKAELMRLFCLDKEAKNGEESL